MRRPLDHLVSRYAVVLCFAVLLGCPVGVPHSAWAETPCVNNANTPPSLTMEKNEDGVWFREGKTPILFYQVKAKQRDGRHRRANYVHPLYDLSGTEILTEDFPDDHRHHRGVFWTWHQTLVNGKRMGDAWTCQRFHWDVVQLDTESHGDGSAVLHAKVDWRSDDAPDPRQPFAREHVRLTVFPRQDEARLIDFQIRIESLVERLELGGSDDRKGYGGFSVRVACPPDLQFLSGEQMLQPQVTAVAGEDWLTLEGTYGDAVRRLTVLTDSRAPAQQDWILRAKRSMQNARFPGRKPIMIPRDQPLRLHYGLVLHEGRPGEKIERWREQFRSLLKSPTDN